MLELLPWVKQWHGDDDRYDMPLGEMWAAHIEGELTSLHLTEADLRAWRPSSKKTRGRKPKGDSPKSEVGGRKSKSGARKSTGDGPKSKSGGRKKVTIARDDLIKAFEALYKADSDGVARNDLADQLGISSSAVGKAAKPLLEEGVWVVAKKRPITYAAGVAT